MLKYMRFYLFKKLLGPFSTYARSRRAKLFVKLMNLHPGMNILDVGGQPEIWDHIEFPLNIWCLNLPGISHKSYHSKHNIRFLEGDGTNMPQFDLGQFDLVFSNSVIEHVGNRWQRERFAREIRRLSKAYWIQTPYKYFPIEAHCGMPFWWFYSEKVRQFLLNRWRNKLPEWTKMVEQTTVVDESELKSLFPEGKLIKEWIILPKSLIAYSPG